MLYAYNYKHTVVDKWRELLWSDYLRLPGNFIFFLILEKMGDSFWAQKIVKFFPFKLKGIGGYRFTDFYLVICFQGTNCLLYLRDVSSGILCELINY